MKALDLFCGAGGLSAGFRESGFSMTGVDISQVAGATYTMNGLGRFILMDLSKDSVEGDYDVIIGGPPCRPWSAVNRRLRGALHPDYHLLSRFFHHVEHCEPEGFLMENVPTLRRDPAFQEMLRKMHSCGYSSHAEVVSYSMFGAPTSRHRLITIGLRSGDPAEFFRELRRASVKPATVRDAIWYLREKGKGEEPHHEWPEFNTIRKYMEYYETCRYGWYVLRWDAPAPSFGNVMKTYILHPDSFNGGTDRVISGRETWLIMGFSRSFQLPEKSSMWIRYQMAVDSVSPYFSRVAGRILKNLL